MLYSSLLYICISYIIVQLPRGNQQHFYIDSIFQKIIVCYVMLEYTIVQFTILSYAPTAEIVLFVQLFDRPKWIQDSAITPNRTNHATQLAFNALDQSAASSQVPRSCILCDAGPTVHSELQIELSRPRRQSSHRMRRQS